VLEVVERFADDLAGTQELRSARMLARNYRDAARAALAAVEDDALTLQQKDICLCGTWLSACAVLHIAGSGSAWKIALRSADSAAEAPAWAAAAADTGALIRDADESAPWSAARKSALRIEERKQAALLRHIIGNPFAPLPSKHGLPAVVTQLADALYQGSDCAYALHDALLEAGHPELARHFREEAWHPKGCAWLDAILGKQ
jgi:hypothetical protein